MRTSLNRRNNALKGLLAPSPMATPWVLKQTILLIALKGQKHYIMAQSLCKIYLHIIFHIKTTSVQILDTDLERVHAYIGKLVNKTGCQTIRVGGVGDHVHALLLLSREETVSHLVEEMKRNSSRWIKSLSPHYGRFAWQGGYAAFSVSQSVVDKTLAYVENQSEHHKKRSFQEEYIDFLKLYNIEYDERYVFRD